MTITTDSWLTDKTTIVVPIDARGSSSRALPVAGRLARRMGLNVRMFRLVDPDESKDPHLEKLEAFASYLGNVDRSFQIQEGTDPVAGIVNSLGETDILCMATAASLLPHGGHLGSVSEAVTRTIDRPMFLVGPRIVPDPPPGPTGRVIVPVDGSELAEAAIEPAAATADRLGVPLWIVSVVSPGAEAAARDALGSGFGAAESGLVRGYAHDVRSKYGIDAQYEVLHGTNPAEAITEYAGDDGTVVMTTHGRSGLNRLVAGSVTTSVLAKSVRSVVVYRPRGD
jgi:nucleotide-binding universal stress UspA family protein